MSENRFCKKDNDGDYYDCIVVSSNDSGDPSDPDVEELGRQYLEKVGLEGKWFFVAQKPDPVTPSV